MSDSERDNTSPTEEVPGPGGPKTAWLVGIVPATEESVEHYVQQYLKNTPIPYAYQQVKI